MFTVMVRSHLLAWLLVGGLAIGGGWAVYELRRPAPEAPVVDGAPGERTVTDVAPDVRAKAPESSPATEAAGSAAGPATSEGHADIAVPGRAGEDAAAEPRPPGTGETARPQSPDVDLSARHRQAFQPFPDIPPEVAPRQLPAPGEVASTSPQPDSGAGGDEPERVEPANKGADARPVQAPTDVMPGAARPPVEPPAPTANLPEVARAAPGGAAPPRAVAADQTPPSARDGGPARPTATSEGEAAREPHGADPDPNTLELAPGVALAPRSAGPPTTASSPRPAQQAQTAAEVQPSPEPAAGPARDLAATEPSALPAVPREPAAPSPAIGADAPSSAQVEAQSAEDAAPRKSLLADTIRRALSALLGSGPDDGPGSPPAVAAPPREPAAPGAAPAASKAATEVARAAPPEEPAAEVRERPAVAPTFDIVRVERDGSAVIAGRAEPGAEVEVRAGDRVIDRVKASRRGEWVATPATPLGMGDQQLTLAARSGDQQAVESEEVVVVAVPEPTPQQTAEAADRESPATPVAVMLPKQGWGQGRILQAPGKISSTGRLALIMVDYDQAGQIQLSGHAPPGAPVRVYVDNRPAGEATGDAEGNWAAELDHSLAPGDYTLRLDQLDAAGRPVARLETPFTRVSQPPIEGQVEVDYVVVQPGNSLWRIARRLFGEGMKYTHIYQANQSQIRDPDLIYPGQVFELPASSGAAG